MGMQQGFACMQEPVTRNEKTKACICAMVWTRWGAMALVSSAPVVGKRGELSYPCLVDGQYLEVPSRDLLKRKPKIIYARDA